MLKMPMRGALAVLLLSLAACGPDKAVESVADAVIPDDVGSIATGRTFKIAPGANATRDMITAMVSVVPGDVIEFGCGFYDLTTTLQLANTEAITIRGCGKDKTVLSFRTSNQPVGILAVNVRGLVVQDLTVADTDGNGFELRAVDHGTLRRVRAFWSTAGGRESETPITKDNFSTVMKVNCTDPATQNPNVPENFFGDTSSPDYTVSDKAGRYGIYPVGSENILIDDAESIGASDAGIYVGQTNNTIIRNSRAAFNVFGFEIENVVGGEYHDNIAECNTGGFLIYDLDGNLRQYGDRTRMYRNIARNNNTYNFTEGGFVANVPPGSGMITLAYDRIDVFDNEFRDNNTGGIIHASYELFPAGAGRPEADKRIDFYTEGMHIFRNKFFNNGNALPLATTTDLQNGDVARVLPVLVGVKNQAACLLPQNLATCAAAAGPNQAVTGYRGAHIVWDGLLDTLDEGCAYPKKPDGFDVPKDSRGKPLHTNEESPTCHYNAYKFTAVAPKTRIVPDWFASCIDDDNTYSADSLKFANFNGTKGLEAVIAAAVKLNPDDPTSPDPLTATIGALPNSDLQNFASSFDVAPHQCVTAYTKNLPLLRAVVIPPFVRSNDTDATPTPAEINTLCGAVMPAGKVNFGAARVNCPTLSQYNLFSNPQDPASAPNSANPGGASDTNTPGVPFVLNTKLFSDYSVKYRVLFMPEGAKAVYKDAALNGENATIIYPVGTIIAKTFSFVTSEAAPVTENAVETRLLIKRINSTSNTTRWDGLAYIWATEDGKRVARFSPSGGSAAVTWNFHDADSNAVLSGSAPAYQIPNANQCLSCHSREDSEAGAAPIGTKVRNLNRPYKSESPKTTGQSEHASKGLNQIAWLCSRNLMLGCPADLGVNATTQIATKLERLPIFNKVGDGHATNTAADIESRARAYLEVNCQHCHNVRGFAASTGLYLNASGPVGLAHGICKRPTATGSEGSGGRPVDIFPGDVARSIMEFRIAPAATAPAARMPPLARSVVHDEGHALITQWIRDVVVVDEAKYPNSGNCGN